MSDFQKDLKEKWNKLNLFGRKPKGFKGSGQKLGTADAPKVSIGGQPCRSTAYGAPNHRSCEC